ncbi:polyol transporter 5 [Sorghum bicolor]|uniref:polyol transporter 5 n=1 Tax=Sorghum bicolor TaxID=4558 RepID=UPI000B423CBE|nr:polyol transporter 5 [Sorghum bicolor]|eukprot:XP_002463087.2 polyol transporter 5 [Sorghum bicolor]
MFEKSNNRDGRSSHAPMRRPLNKYGFATAMLSAATPLFLGYDLAVVYNTVVMAREDLKLVACTVALSSLLGVIAAVGAQHIIGDRRTVLLSTAVLCAGAIARGLATGFAAFTAGVFVNGVGIGLALTAVPAYAAELSPCSARRVLAAHPDGLVYLGCILGSVVYSMGFSRIPAHLAWRLSVAICTAAPALLSAIILFMPETPRWLVSRDRENNARHLLSRTSATPDEAELRLLEIKVECGKPHDGSDEPLAVTKRGRWWREELGMVRELLVHPTEPLRRAVVTALVAKVFQQASGIGSILQYVQQRVFRDVGVPSSALVVFVFVLVMSFPMSLVLVELGWLLVRALASGCRLSRRTPTNAGSLTRRQEEMKGVRGLSATMLLSLMALVWIALGPPPCDPHFKQKARS